MDSLTMKMERVSHARIFVEVDASKKLVDQVEFILPNDVVRKQSVVYKFTPKFCTACNHFGHLKDTCQGNHPPTATEAASNHVAAVRPVDTKKGHTAEWTLVKRRHQKQQQQPVPKPVMAQQQPTIPPIGAGEQGCLSRPQTVLNGQE
ncbi:hypothetical protein Sango_2330200 [Sesamum angolense]|uniref:Zinc knuckle CX2CX4HX4C domain-containing protein n=1 Tax=Sesamum angolense TaxID=2727404 RepID=A0AAE1WAR7_9LAMI|nr:hypothetical protein Sango_2330200 [Sesamum angolense]